MKILGASFEDIDPRPTLGLLQDTGGGAMAPSGRLALFEADSADFRQCQLCSSATV
jgi:hypothetical protein